MTITWNAAGATDVGLVRGGNEDSFRLDSHQGIFLVADGMGGHAAGEVASALAADAAIEILMANATGDESQLEDAFRRCFHEARRRIVEYGRGHPRTTGMGTTLTVGKLNPDGSLYIGHLGDSRLYQLRGSQLLQRTQDHTWVQREVEAGRVPSEAARAHPLAHILTRVLTADEPANPDLSRGVVAPGDSLLLCTDGLHNLVDPRSLLTLLTPDSVPEDVASRLISAANQGGGLDNVTAVVVQIHSANGDDPDSPVAD